MEIEGLIIRDLGQLDGISKAGNPWKKHEWVLETITQYPRKVKFTVFGDKTETVKFEVGKTYIISVDIESREYNERWYTDVNAFAARLSDNQVGPQAGPINTGTTEPASTQGPVFPQPAPQNPFAKPTEDFSAGDSQEDLPF